MTRLQPPDALHDTHEGRACVSMQLLLTGSRLSWDLAAAGALTELATFAESVCFAAAEFSRMTMQIASSMGTVEAVQDKGAPLRTRCAAQSQRIGPACGQWLPSVASRRPHVTAPVDAEMQPMVATVHKQA